jgi:hypothetical protein
MSKKSELSYFAVARRHGGCSVRNRAIAVLRRRCPTQRGGHCHREPTTTVAEERVTEYGNRIDATLLRAFLKRAFEDDAIADPVNELLFEHIVAGRYHPSVVAESLPSYITELLHAATREDWQAVADKLIAEAREVNGEV